MGEIKMEYLFFFFHFHFRLWKYFIFISLGISLSRSFSVYHKIYHIIWAMFQSKRENIYVSRKRAWLSGKQHSLKLLSLPALHIDMGRGTWCQAYSPWLWQRIGWLMAVLWVSTFNHYQHKNVFKDVVFPIFLCIFI